MRNKLLMLMFGLAAFSIFSCKTAEEKEKEAKIKKDFKEQYTKNVFPIIYYLPNELNEERIRYIEKLREEEKKTAEISDLKGWPNDSIVMTKNLISAVRLAAENCLDQACMDAYWEFMEEAAEVAAEYAEGEITPFVTIDNLIPTVKRNTKRLVN